MDQPFSGMTLRRLRQNPLVRDLSRQIRISPKQFIQPLFVVENLSEPETIPGLTGVFRENASSLLRTIEADMEKGVRKFILFSIPKEKHARIFNPDFASQQIQEIKKRFGKDLFLAVDVCLCSSTEDGHCGIVESRENAISTDETVRALSSFALSYAQAGADCVAPSDMMDGRVASIRSILEKNTLHSTLIMSYSAKFHSKFYGPFRVAADCSPKGSYLKDRATYQIDPAFPNDALLSSLRDANEGADILMVKPGLPYLDMLSHLSKEIPKPWAVYQVSGEYAGTELLAQHGLIDGPKAHVEVWTAFVRAGASMIISYGARHARDYLERVENDHSV